MTAQGEALAGHTSYRAAQVEQLATQVDHQRDRIRDLEHVVRTVTADRDRIRAAHADLLATWRKRAGETETDADWFPPVQRAPAAAKAETLLGCIADLTAAVRRDTHDVPAVPDPRSGS